MYQGCSRYFISFSTLLVLIAEKFGEVYVFEEIDGDGIRALGSKKDEDISIFGEFYAVIFPTLLLLFQMGVYFVTIEEGGFSFQ